jgi:ribosomal protein S18 acetylase RimI-like enzyme
MKYAIFILPFLISSCTQNIVTLPEYQHSNLRYTILGIVIDQNNSDAKVKSLGILRLDTMKNYEKALSLYRSAGFYEIERYNDNYIAEVYMEKRL